MANHHMDTGYASSIFNTSYSSISSAINNISYLTNSNFVQSTDSYFPFGTQPNLPPLPPPPVTGVSASYPPLSSYPTRRNEHTNLLYQHQSRSTDSYILGRESATSTAVLPAYNNMMYPVNVSWPTFEPTFDMRSFPTLSRPIKQKRPRMSLQKRLLVNSRERERMRVLNKAFESLRDALPCYIADGHMAKITTLRLAINYIKALTDLLNDHSNNHDNSMQQSTKTGFAFNPEQNREELFTNIFRDSTVDGIRPAFKNLDERFVICKKT